MVACCAEKTYAGTTIADLVSRGTVSRTTFYKLFTDKRDCFDAAVTLCIERIAATLADAAAGQDSPAEATRRATVAGLELLAAEPELALVLSGDVLGVEPLLVDRYSRMIVPALESMWAEAGEPPRKHFEPRARLRPRPAARLPRGRRGAGRPVARSRPRHRLPGDRPVRRA